MSDALLPTLPPYAKPRISKPAVIPDGLQPPKPPGSLNKLISRMIPKMLKGKLRAPKMRAKLPTGKPGKKHKVKFI